MLTVRDLYCYLENLDPDMPVIIQKDAEGNGYSPLVRVEESRYRAYNAYSGEATSRPKDSVPCVVLKPVN